MQRRKIKQEEDNVTNESTPRYEVGKKLGAGSYGSVYEAIILSDPLSDSKKKDFVVKYFDHSFNASELNIQARYRKVYPPKENSVKHESLIEKVQGVPFSYFNTKSMPLLKKLDLCFQLALRINLYHHNTPSTGSAIVHGDISTYNVLFSDSVDLVDFGKSFDIEDNPDLLIERNEFGVNSAYFPSEVTHKGSLGIKTDIYMAASLICHSLNISERPKEVQCFSLRFFQRCFFEYKNRPNSDEFLKFFTTLYLYCNADKFSKSNIENVDSEHFTNLKKQYADTLCLLSLNLWNECSVEELRENKGLMKCLTIFANDKNLFSIPKDIINNSNLQKAIICLKNNNILNSNALDFLSQNVQLQELVVKGNLEHFKKEFSIKLLSDYIEHRRKRQRKETGAFIIDHFITKVFTDHDAETKISAADKLLRKLQGTANPIYTPQEFSSLNDGELGRIYHFISSNIKECALKKTILPNNKSSLKPTPINQQMRII